MWIKDEIYEAIAQEIIDGARNNPSYICVKIEQSISEYEKVTFDSCGFMMRDGEFTPIWWDSFIVLADGAYSRSHGIEIEKLQRFIKKLW